jgi:hypothetical protein
MTELHKQGRYDRMSEDYLKLTGATPTSMADFVKLHAAEFTRSSRFGAEPRGFDAEIEFSERQIAFSLTKAAATCLRGGTTCCPIVPEAPGLATGLNGPLS